MLHVRPLWLVVQGAVLYSQSCLPGATTTQVDCIPQQVFHFLLTGSNGATVWSWQKPERCKELLTSIMRFGFSKLMQLMTPPEAHLIVSIIISCCSRRS